MSISFDRPIGAAGDVKELEYVSALHQTDLECMRTDGSLRDEDIRIFLLSRYGIDVTVEEVRETVLKGMGGGSGDEDCVDLMEMVAILMIPTLLKAAQTEASDVPLNPKLIAPPTGSLQLVLGMILEDVTSSRRPKELTPTLIKDILNGYGETELAEDDQLVDEMVQCAFPSVDEGVNQHASSSTQSNNGLLLDVNTFARALTYDVKLYDTSNEIRVSSNFDDIFLTHNTNDAGFSTDTYKDEEEEAGASMHREELTQLSQTVKRRFTAGAIDFAAGTYRSKGLTVLLWATFILTYFAYNYNYANQVVGTGNCIAYNLTDVAPWTENKEAIGCRIYMGIAKWMLIFLFASLYGLVFIGLGSIGNSVQTSWFVTPLIGFTVVFTLTLAQFIGIVRQQESLSRLSNRYLKISSLILGMIVCGLHLSHSCSLLFPSLIRMIPNIMRQYYVATGTLVGESNIKQAAAYKLTGMVENAIAISRLREKDGVVDTHFAHGLLSYAKHGKTFREVGGFFWTWKRMFNNELTNREGLWFSTRFLASNLSQYIVSIFVLLAGIGLVQTALNDYDKDDAKRIVTKALNKAIKTDVDESLVSSLTSNITRIVSDFLVKQSSRYNCTAYFESVNQTYFDTACYYVGQVYQCNPSESINYVCALVNLTSLQAAADSAVDNSASVAKRAYAYLQAAGFDSNKAQKVIQQTIASATNETIDSIYPARQYMVIIPIVSATITAFVASLYIATIYLPSHASTTLKLRSGVIPTLRDKNFHHYRVAADQVTILTGSLFWGALISSAAVGGFVALFVFLLMWQVTVFFVQQFVALGVGITVTVIFKIILVAICRCTQYRGFYRISPTAANITSLALECANFALSAGFVFLRLVKLLVAAAIYIGRIDTPFLAPGVGSLGSLQLDAYPYIYRKDILSSEAHRHPYIETLGVMYLMKLRYGENFAKSAGSCWRLVFVYALMPWLQRYRILARPELKLLSNPDGNLLQSDLMLHRLVTGSDDDGNADNDNSNLSNIKASDDAANAERFKSRRNIIITANDDDAVVLEKKLAAFQKEIDELQKENHELKSHQKEMDELQKENHELKSQLRLGGAITTAAVSLQHPITGGGAETSGPSDAAT